MRRWLPLLSITLWLTACGPSAEQMGTAVLLAAPVAVIAGLLAILLLVHLWRPLAMLPFSARPALLAAAFALLLAIAVRLGVDRPDDDLVPAAIWLSGTSYLSLVLVGWRIWLAVDRASASTWAFVPAFGITVLPALLMAREVLPQSFVEPMTAVWIFPGYLGAVTAGILVILLIEVAVRRRRDRVRG